MRQRKAIHGQLYRYQADLNIPSKSLPSRLSSHKISSKEKIMYQRWEREGRVKKSRGSSSNHPSQNGHKQIPKAKMQKNSRNNTYKSKQQQRCNHRCSLRSTERKISRENRKSSSLTHATISFICSKEWDTISAETGEKTTNLANWTKRKSYS